jgi:hypothetical protein
MVVVVKHVAEIRAEMLLNSSIQIPTASPNPEKANPDLLAFWGLRHPLGPVVTSGSNAKRKPLDNGEKGVRRSDKLA